ncbi:MAG: hypothetical protein CSA64_04335 [Arachnia propionica]|nr:MAG: hypothetical protein CSA64_04335 [Arachnia propionica]
MSLTQSQEPSLRPKPPSQVRARRSPRLIALGVLLVCLGALGAAGIYLMSTDQVSVVVMARDVARGSVISSADLTLLELPAGSKVDHVEASSLDELIGQTALTDLPAGAIPAARLLGSAPIPMGQSLVGLLLTPGKLPATKPAVGDRVSLVGLAETATAVTLPAVVASVPQVSEDGSGYIVDVLVASPDAATVAALAAKGEIALITLGAN